MLFADLVGSTELATELDPEDLRGRLEPFFEAARSALEQHGGTVEKYIGDAVMAVFGAPERIHQHADRAVQCAVELARTINSRRPGGFEVGVGVNTGPVVAGSIGGAGRLSFRSLPSHRVA